jgi:hypothetical protein
LNRFVETKARVVAKARGQKPNFSQALSDLIIFARHQSNKQQQEKAA